MRFQIVIAACLVAAAARSAEIIVGPGGVPRIEDAVAKAVPGDVIVVQAASLDKVAVVVNKPKLTIRSAGTNRVAISGKGFDYSGRGSVPRAVFQFNKGADGSVLDGFEISGAHNESHNGSGVRINQANDVTVRNCDIHNNDMGIMSNGDGTTNSANRQVITSCAIHHNGDKTEPGYNHNLYLGGTSVTVTECDIHHSLTGHNLKSRAHRTTILGCRIHDSANRELDFVDAADTESPGSDARVAGCTIEKAADCSGNRGVIHFGQDGGKMRDGKLVLNMNTIRTPFVSPVVVLSSPKARAVIGKNTIENSGNQRSGQILADAKASKEEVPVEGVENKIASSFAGPALDALGLKETTITDR